MKCKYHKSSEAVGTCRKCGASYCELCLINLGPIRVCKQCYGIDPEARGTITQIRGPVQSVVMGPEQMMLVVTDSSMIECPRCGSKDVKGIPQPYTGVQSGLVEFICHACNKPFVWFMGVTLPEFP